MRPVGVHGLRWGVQGPRCWFLGAGFRCRVPAAMCRVADAGVQSGGVQGPGRRDLVQGAGCNVLGAKPWAARARGTGRAADDEGTTELSLEDGAAAASPLAQKRTAGAICSRDTSWFGCKAGGKSCRQSTEALR